MISERKLSANRANAKRSTGPRTKEGKFMSRRNAVKHGLAAKEQLTRIKASEDYVKLERALFDDLQPRGAAQEILVERIASLSCRLRRVHLVEELYLRMECRDLRDEAEVEDIEIEEFAHNENDEMLGLYLTITSKYTVIEQLQRYEIIYNRALNATFRQLQLLKDLAAREEAEETPQDAPAQDELAACRLRNNEAPIEPEPSPDYPQNEIAQNEPTADANSLTGEGLQQPSVEKQQRNIQCNYIIHDDSPVPGNQDVNAGQSRGDRKRGSNHR